MNGKERVIAHIDGKDVDCLPNLPITMQFAAGRIGAKYYDYATDYRVLVEGQLRVAEEFQFDYVNVMTDPATEAADLGAAIKWFPDQPCAMDESHALLGDPTSLASLKLPDPTATGRMLNRIRAVSLLKERIGGQLLIEGWIEGPCAEAADLRGINTLMLDFYDDPAFVQDLFEFILEMGLQFAKAQIEAGADSIGIGDAAASLIGPRFYNEMVLPYERKMVEGIHAMGGRVRLHICGNTRDIARGMGTLGFDIVDLDFLCPMDHGRTETGPDQVLLGNIDPVRVLRDGTPETVYAAVEECHRQAGPRFIVGPGCEVTRDTSPDNLKALVQYAKDHRPEG